MVGWLVGLCRQIGGYGGPPWRFGVGPSHVTRLQQVAVVLIMFDSNQHIDLVSNKKIIFQPKTTLHISEMQKALNITIALCRDSTVN